MSFGNNETDEFLRCLCICKRGFVGKQCEQLAECPVECPDTVGVPTGAVADDNCGCACLLGRENIGDLSEESVAVTIGDTIAGCSIRLQCPESCGPDAIRKSKGLKFIEPGERCCEPLNTVESCAQRGLYLCPNYNRPGFVNHLKNHCVRSCRGIIFELLPLL